ncbi:hypothetical protein [Nannocystis pusilla]|uniref:hypothetical protein n=1 Tax=Nannocystis pusilla TaxID=889268 RepID=UPI003B7E8AB2
MIEQAELDRVLLERFGFSEFRPGQRRSVEELLLGSGSLLCIQPTGYGKSLCINCRRRCSTGSLWWCRRCWR